MSLLRKGIRSYIRIKDGDVDHFEDPHIAAKDIPKESDTVIIVNLIKYTTNDKNVTTMVEQFAIVKYTNSDHFETDIYTKERFLAEKSKYHISRISDISIRRMEDGKYTFLVFLVTGDNLSYEGEKDEVLKMYTFMSKFLVAMRSPVKTATKVATPKQKKKVKVKSKATTEKKENKAARAYPILSEPSTEDQRRQLEEEKRKLEVQTARMRQDTATFTSESNRMEKERKLLEAQSTRVRQEMATLEVERKKKEEELRRLQEQRKQEEEQLREVLQQQQISRLPEPPRDVPSASPLRHSPWEYPVPQPQPLLDF